jgi:phosphohistidine phosphatase SixA
VLAEKAAEAGQRTSADWLAGRRPSADLLAGSLTQQTGLLLKSADNAAEEVAELLTPAGEPNELLASADKVGQTKSVEMVEYR